MAVRAYWKGSLKLSLVSCPVLPYPASTSAEKTRFHMINKETGNRLKQQWSMPRPAMWSKAIRRAAALHSRARRATHRPSKKAHRSAARARKAN